MSLAIDNNNELQLPESLVQYLTELLGDRFSTAQSVREHHGKGEAYHTAAVPDGVPTALRKLFLSSRPVPRTVRR